MNTFLRFLLAAVAAFFISIVSVWAEKPEKRVALVVGNGNYAAGSALRNPVNDATDVRALLGKAGFSTVMAGSNLTLSAFREKVAEFSTAAADADVALFFYAGHGMEQDGVNFLVPVDAKATKRFQIPSVTIPLDEVMRAVAKGPKLKIIILDCCRNDPLGRSFERGDSAGLATPKNTPKGTLLMFSAAPGTTANDGDGRNSPFTEALKARLLSPGLQIEQTFKAVGAAVSESTGGRQEPWMNIGFYGSFAFVPGQAAEAVGKLEPMRPAVPVMPDRVETGGGLLSATKSAPFVNGLGMKFVPVPGTGVLMSVWETRVQDYGVYVKEKGIRWEKPDFAQGPTHPAVNMSWEEARAFAEWLSKREVLKYRIPSDEEWSAAVGLNEPGGLTPQEKNNGAGPYPWGSGWPPRNGAGNFDSKLKVDDFKYTAPVGSFAPNELGIYDLAGNVWEWCEDAYDPTLKGSDGTPYRVLRGASWRNYDAASLRSSYRGGVLPSERDANRGIRLVVVVR